MILNQAGLFFRTEGTGANPFDGTTQGDAIRNITGRIGPHRYQTMRGAMTGAFTQQGGGNDDFYTEIPNNNGQSGFVFDASRVVPTAPENRPRNNTFRIWRKDSH